MPNGEVSPFDKLLREWETKAATHQQQLEVGTSRLDELQASMQRLQPIPPKEPTVAETLFQKAKPLLLGWGPLTPEFGGRGFAAKKALQTEIDAVVLDITKAEFYSRLYSAIPVTVMGNQVFTIEEALDVVRPPIDLPAGELDGIRESIQGMIDAYAGTPEPGLETGGAVELPELGVPIRPLPPTGIQVITVDAILKALTTPRVPEPVLPDEEWNELFKMSYPEYADMSQVEIVEAEAKRIMAESRLTNEKMANFQTAIAEMPDYELSDFLKELVIQPGLALLEVVNVYFEKVTQPWAAQVYRHFIPGIETLYQQNRMTTDSDWEALQKAWEEWDAPGGGVPEFLFKYMFMETLVDPLTLLAIFTLGTSMIAGTTGRFVRFATIMNKANRIVFAPFEVPFDGIKSLISKIPKTVSQRAAVSEGMTGRIVKQYMEKYTKGRLINKGMTMKDWEKLSKRAIRYAFDNPAATDEIAETGRVLLKHKPIDQSIISRWSGRLGLAMPEGEITQSMVADINTIFEAMFQKYGARTGRLLTPREATKRLLEKLGLGGSDEKTAKLAQRLLEQRASNIVADAASFSKLKSPGEALQQLMRRNFKTHVAIEESVAFLAKKYTGRIASLFDDVGDQFLTIWQNYVEKMLIRPLAESYLTFGMYGPMNVIEDLWRSTLGGVFPRRMTADRVSQLSVGLSIDPHLVDPAIGISEAIGRLKRKGGDEQWNNWILQMAAVGQKDWADKLYTGLVRLPAGFGMDFRRNFVGQKYLTLFKEMGGESVEAILKAEGRAPILSDKRLLKELKRAVYDAKTTGNIDNIRNTKDMFTRAKMYRKEVQGILKEHPDLPNNVRDFITQSYDDNTLFHQGGKSISSRMGEANEILMDQYLKGAEYATKQFQQLTDVLTQLEVRNPEEMAHLLLNLNVASQVYGATPKQIMAQTTIRTRGLPLAERQVRFDKTFDDIAEFMDKAGGNLDQMVEKVRLDMQAGKTFNQEYTDKASRLFDLLQTKRQLGDQFRSENMAFRRDYFAGVNRKDMTSEWWDSLFRQMDGQYHDFNVKMAAIDGDFTRAIADVDIAAGIQPFSRNAIRVVDRPLAPQDVASLVGAQGDDLSRAIMDNLITVNDKDMFIEHIMAKVRPGDEGFTREAIGQVYDQISYSLKVSPESMSWITSKQMEMKAVNDDLHYLYNSKLLPDNEIKEIGRYVDETADAVEKLVYEPRVVVGTELTPRLGGEGVIYHVTFTDKVSKIKKEGVLPLQTSNWVKAASKERYGSGEIFATENLDDAIKWASEMDWEFNHEFGSGKISIIPMRTTSKWDIDIADPLSRAGNKGNWLKRGQHVPSKELGEGAVLTHDMVIQSNKGGYKVPAALKAPAKILPPVIKPEFQGLQEIRQNAMDEAQKWYFKEYTDYTNANAVDAIMKGVFPFWTYETQRWFWLPRSFVKHPGTFTAFERWQDNTDYGYIAIPGTSIEANPFRGTIYGPLTTRLTRRDFPEYYDAWEGSEKVVGFMDWISRYGFYPGGHVTIPMALFGGVEAQTGEVIPPIWRTPMMLLQAAAPDNQFVNTIVERVFPDRFRNYLNILEVTARGYNGTLINTKLRDDIPLTEEEEAAWESSKQAVALYSALFEQGGLFRLRKPEQKAVYEAATAYIEEKYGYTEDQQKWLRMHGHRIWDQIGGMSFEDMQILEELDYFRYQGLVRPLLPGKQQAVLDRLELDWDEIDRYVENQRQDEAQLEREFRGGRLSAQDFNAKLVNIYDDRRKFIDNKMEENPNLTLEGRKAYYEEFNVPIPVLHPLRELLNLYFSIELKELRNPETGALEKDWDTFWALRFAVEEAIPDHLKGEWKTYLSRKLNPLEVVRGEVYRTYFSKYNYVWQKVLDTYQEDEKKLIEEFLHLERMNLDRKRQAEIKAMTRADGKRLVSSFRTGVSNARTALRFANPTLDAWLYYWGRTTAFQTPQAEVIYNQIAKDTGRRLE